jgi:hypothetical protein
MVYRIYLYYDNVVPKKRCFRIQYQRVHEALIEEIKIINPVLDRIRFSVEQRNYLE